MNFINEHRKVFTRVDGKEWCFKAIDGSVISKPDNADDELTKALAKLAGEQELVSGENKAVVEAGGKKYDVDVERLLDISVGQVLTESAKLNADKEALISVDGKKRVTYKQFNEDAEAFAKYLLSIGVKKGERVGLWMANGVESVTACYAISKIGAVVLAFTPYEKQERMEELVRRSELSTFILYRGAKSTENIDMLAGDMYPEIKTQKFGELHLEKAPTIRRVILVGATDEYALPGTFDFNEAMELGRKMPDDALEAATKAINVKEDLAYIIFTSGSTGFPKGVMLSHLNIVENSYTMINKMTLTPEDKVCVQIQLFHTFGSVASVLTGIQAGVPMLLLSRFKPADSLKVIEREQCTVVSGVPTMFIGYVEELKKNPDKYDIQCIDKGIIAGAACPEQMMRDIEEILTVKHVIACYGLTETSPCVSATEPDASVYTKSHTVGKIVPGVEVKFIDPETEAEITDGTPGEICVKGYSLMHGYMSEPEKTKSTFTKDGWLRTGDMGSFDDEKNLVLGDRLKDIIIRSGENIGPGDIERFIGDLEGVQEVYAIGVKDYKYGEIVGVFVKRSPGSSITAEDIRDQCDGNITTLSIPTYYWFVGEGDGDDIKEFPLLNNGKVSKPELRKIAEATKENKVQLDAHKPKK